MDVGADWLLPDWPAPAGVKAVSTLRGAAAADDPYGALNLALHVGDDPVRVQEHRERLRRQLALPAEPAWLQQVHGRRVVRLPTPESTPRADAAWTECRGVVCAVMTADCLPVLFCDDDARCVAVAHAGWRGLAEGVLEATVAALPVGSDRLLAWLGPAIGRAAFEVGEEVRRRFVEHADSAVQAFTPASAPGKFMGDLPLLARQRLAAAGVTRVFGGDRCTWSEPEHFFSFRRQSRCGRMASLVWLDA